MLHFSFSNKFMTYGLNPIYLQENHFWFHFTRPTYFILLLWISIIIFKQIIGNFKISLLRIWILVLIWNVIVSSHKIGPNQTLNIDKCNVNLQLVCYMNTSLGFMYEKWKSYVIGAAFVISWGTWCHTYGNNIQVSTFFPSR